MGKWKNGSRGNRSVSDSLVCSYEKGLSIISGGGQMGCILEMHKRRSCLVVSVGLSHVLLPGLREEDVGFRNCLITWM